jgi:hypothetical protein
MTQSQSHNDANAVWNAVDHSIMSGIGFFNGSYVEGERTYAKLAFKTGASKNDEQQFEFGSFYVGDNAMPAIGELASSYDDQENEAAISVKFAVLDMRPTLRNGHVWLHGLLCRIQSV